MERPLRWGNSPEWQFRNRRKCGVFLYSGIAKAANSQSNQGGKSKGVPLFGTPLPVEESLGFSSCWIKSASAIDTALSLARQTIRSAHLLQLGPAAALALLTRLVLVVLLIFVLIVVFVLSLGLRLLGEGFALAFMAAGGVVIRHLSRHDEFF